MLGKRILKALALVVSCATAVSGPGLGGWALWAGDEIHTQYDSKHNTMAVAHVETPKIDQLIEKLDDPELKNRATAEQIDQMKQFLTRFKGAYKDDQESPEAQAALKQLTTDLADKNKDIGLTLAEIYDRLSPGARKDSDEGTFVTVVNQSGKSQTVKVTDSHTGNVLFTQSSAEIDDDVYKKVIKRPDPNDSSREVVDAIVIETKKGAATEQRVLYNRRVELLLKNLKKLYYDQPSLARKIKDNCNVADPANHQAISQITTSEDKRDDNLTPAACQKMVEFFDGKRAAFVKNTKADGFDVNILQYLDKLAAAAKNNALDKLDWKELQAVQRKAMEFYNDNQLETMQKMVLIELKTYFSQVTNAQVKETKNGTEALDATMKDLGELQKIFDEFKKGNFDGYSLLMTKFFAKSDIEDPKYVSKDIMLLASEAFADVANAVAAQKRILQGGLSGEEVDATIEESQAWLKLAQVHLQEFDMHTLSIQLERLESGHLRDHLGLRTDDLKFTVDGKEYVLSAKDNQAQALRLAQIAHDQYLPKLDEINGEVKANLVKQAIAGFYLTYQNVTRAYLYDDTMQERVRTLSSKVREIKDLYLSLVFDRVKNSPEFKGKTETEKLQGNLYELFVKNLARDNPAVQKTVDDLEALAKKISDLAQIQSAERVRDEVKPLLDEFSRLSKAVMFEVSGGKDGAMPLIDDVKKEAQNLAIKQSKVFGAVQDFSSQARIYDMMNELDLYCAKYASSEFVTSKGDTAMSKTIGMKWWDRVMDFFTGGHRDDIVDVGMKYDPLTKKAFEMLGQNRDERHRIMLLLAQGKFQEAIDRISSLDPNHDGVARATKALQEKRPQDALKELDKLDCKDSQRSKIRGLIDQGKYDDAIKELRKLDGALRALDEYEEDKALADPFEMLDFDSSVTKAPENKNLMMAQGVIQNMFGQLQNYIMGYTLTAAVLDTAIVSVLTLGLGAVSRYAIGAAKGVIAFGEALQAAKTAEAVGEISRMARVLQTLTNIGKWIISVPGKMIAYVGKWLESSMISIRNTLGIANLSKDLSAGQKAVQIVRIGLWNAVKFNVKNAAIMGGASGFIQGGQYLWSPSTSQYKGFWDAWKQGAVSGVGFGAKSGVFILMSPVPVSAFGEGTAGNVVRGIANSPGPLSSLTQGVAKLAASDSAVATMGPLGALKEISLSASPGFYAAAKALVWSGAMFDGALKYMLASAVAHNVASVGAYYEYKIEHAGEKDSEGATVEMQALSQGEAFGMTMAEMSWLLLPVHQQSNDKAVKQQIEREDAFNAAVNQGKAAEIAQSNGVEPVLIDKPWGMQGWGERIDGFWSRITGGEREAPKAKLFVDANLRSMANKVEMKGMSNDALVDVATTPRENIGKFRLKESLGRDFDAAQYANEPIAPSEAAEGESRFSKSQGGTVDVRKLNIRVTDEAISAARDLLSERLEGRKAGPARLAILRDKADYDAAAGQIRGAVSNLEKGADPAAVTDRLETAAKNAEELAGKSDNPLVKQRAEKLAESARELADLVKEGKSAPKEIKETAATLLQERRLQTLAETVGNLDLAGQGAREPGTLWQKFKDMVKGSPVETPSQAIVRNLKGEVDAELSDKTAESGRKLDATAKQVKDAAEALKAKLKGGVTAADVEGSVDEIKRTAARIEAAADDLGKAADRLGDANIKKQAQQLGDAAREIARQAGSDRFTAEGFGEGRDARKAQVKLYKLAEAVSAAGDILSGSGARLEASELSRKAIGDINGEMSRRIDDKLAESNRLRGEGSTEAADALEREGLALKTMRSSLEADALLQYVNDGMARDFQSYRQGRITRAQVDRSIELFLASWENGVMGPNFKNKFGAPITGFRGPQREMIKQILTSMAEGHDMTMGLLKTGGGKTLISFVLLSFMDTLARQKGKQGAIFVTVNGDLVAQAYEDYRAFFNGRDPAFEIKTVADFMADEAMAQASGGMSPFKTHDVVFDEYDLLGTQTALSLGSDNGRLSHPELDPVQKALQQGVKDLKKFSEQYASQIGTNVDGRKLMDLVNAKDSPLAEDFKNLRAKYVDAVRNAISETRGSEFKQAVLDLKEPVFDAKTGKFTYVPSNLTREQFTAKYGMSPEQVVTEMRDEHDHAFGGGWRKLWDVGVIDRQHGGLDGYITKTFLGGLEALSKPDLAKFYDAKLDPTGTKLVQYHNDVPLDNLDTLYRSYLELKHGIPLTLDFDNLVVINFADLNLAAKKSGATVVALSGTLPQKVRDFMERPDLDWNILGEAYGGQRVTYQKMDPLTRGVRDAIGLVKDGKLDAAIARVDRLDIEPEGRDAVKSLLKEGKLDAAMGKLVDLAPANSQYHEVVSSIRDLVDTALKGGPRNLGVFFAESKEAYGKFEAEMDALSPKYADHAETVKRYDALNAQSKSLAARLETLRKDPGAQADLAKAQADYKKVEGELDPLRTIPRSRRVVAVTPDSNFLATEWLMPEAVEGKNMGALQKGDAEAVILIGQSGFRGLDLNFKAYSNGKIKMYITDPGSLSTVNRVQLTGRIDTGRMPPGVTPEIIGVVRGDTFLGAQAYMKIADNAFREAAGAGVQARWQALQGVLRDHVPAGKTLDEAMVRDYLAQAPPADDEIEAKTYSDARYLYQDFQSLRELSKLLKPEELQDALKDPAKARQLAARPEVARVLLTQDAMQTIVGDLQNDAEAEALKSSGIDDPKPANPFQAFFSRLFAPRAPAAAPIPAGAN